MRTHMRAVASVSGNKSAGFGDVSDDRRNTPFPHETKQSWRVGGSPKTARPLPTQEASVAKAQREAKNQKSQWHYGEYFLEVTSQKNKMKIRKPTEKC